MTDIRTFRAKSMQQALQLVRTHLGPQAAVLHTRQLKRGMLGWLTGRTQIEVTASKDFRVPSRLAPPVPQRDTTKESTAAGTDAELASSEDRAIQDEIRHLRLMVEQLIHEPSQRPKRNDEEQSAFEHLLSLDFPLRDAEQLIADLTHYHVRVDKDGGRDIWQPLAELIARRIAVRGPTEIKDGSPQIVALVGPTGVGKTTTIAKLAANHRLRENHRVGLITVDTYRIAAVEQLKTYAEIIDLPMEVVSSPTEMRAALEKLGNLDLILIDTAGRSPLDEIRLRELKAIIHEAKPHEIHLVLSVVAGASSLSRSLATFREVGITSLLLTKLDEAPTLGALWSVIKTGLPLSYVTDGQDVPDDIALADALSLSREILGKPFIEADV